MTLLKILFGLFLFFGIAQFCHRQTGGFTIQNISSSLLPRDEWEVPSLTSEENLELQHALAQPFFYLSAGGSCYAFASEDGNYVIKFFKYHRLNSFGALASLPLPGPLDEYMKTRFAQQKKIKRVFLSVKRAFIDLKNETGLIYIHLNKTKNLHKNLIIVDKLGIQHSLALDSMEFIVQKKAELAYDYIKRKIAQKDPSVAKLARAQIMDVIRSISEKGYKDKDPNIQTNYGFIQDRPIKIDVGSFIPYENLSSVKYLNKKIIRSLKFFDAWLKETDPHFPEDYKIRCENDCLR